MAGQVVPESVKRAGEIQNITAEQAAEYLKCQEDPEYFIENYLQITDIDEGVIPFKLYDYQKDMIRNYHQHRFNINLLSRQSGKCVSKDINITVRNKKTGEVYELPIGDFYKMCQNRKGDG